jgi:hypothetical protein
MEWFGIAFFILACMGISRYIKALEDKNEIFKMMVLSEMQERDRRHKQEQYEQDGD